jgi:hypothetical protein
VKTPEPELSDIKPEMARHVLAHFGCSGGHLAGSFTMSLIHTITCADPQNQAILFGAFPGYVKAVVLAQRTDDGIARLQEIGRSDLGE